MKIGDLVRTRHRVWSGRGDVGIIIKIDKDSWPQIADDMVKILWFGYLGGNSTWESLRAVEVISENR